MIKKSLFFAVLSIALLGCSDNLSTKQLSFDEEVNKLYDIMKINEVTSKEFNAAVKKLEYLVNQGCVVCAFGLADIYWRESNYGTLAESYKWNWVDYSLRGYSVDEFHADSVVEELFEEIGSSMASNMRVEAENWMSIHQIKK